MKDSLVEHYETELRHLREMGGEFAQAFPKIAGRLGLGETECADPYVERLLEGFAFLAARIQLKIEAEFPRFVQHLLETVYPHYLCPTPSMAIVQFEPALTEGSLAEGPVVPRGSALRSSLAGDQQTRCLYTTAHDVTLWPLELVEAAYHIRDLSTIGLPELNDVRAAIRIRLRAGAGKRLCELPLDELVLHIRGEGGMPMRIYEQLFTHVAAVVVHSPDRPAGWCEVLPASSVQQVGFDDQEALLPYGARSFQGHRLLQEYFTIPQRFMFAKLTGLRAGLERCEGDTVDLTLLLRQDDVQLENTLAVGNFALFCTPAINLFEKRLDRIHLDDRFSEFHVVPDRTASLDYEIHSIKRVTGYGGRGHSQEQTFEPFYCAKDGESDESDCYYALNRVPRMLSEKERRGHRRSTTYTGSEVYLSLVDINAAPYRTDLRQLGLVARCTNRDLPIQLPVGQGPSDFSLDIGAPVEAIRCLGHPTNPCHSHAHGEFAWRLTSHLTPNYFSITDTDGGDAASALRAVLDLYNPDGRVENRKQIDGVRAVASRAVVRRIGAGGPTSFARGLEVTVNMDETAFKGSGIFLLGAVLERFFAKYVAINVFTTTVLQSLQRGEVKRWPVRIGQQQNL